MIRIAEFVRLWRARKGRTQEDVAYRARERGAAVSATQVRQIEIEATKDPRLLTVCRVALGLDLEPWELLAPDEVHAAWDHWLRMPEATRRAGRQAWESATRGEGRAPPPDLRTLTDDQAARLAAFLIEVRRKIGEAAFADLSTWFAAGPTPADLQRVAEEVRKIHAERPKRARR